MTYAKKCAELKVALYELARVKAERDEYKPFYDALRARHNGYDPGFCEATGYEEPATPKLALDELLEEADALAVDATAGLVLNRLVAERDHEREHLWEES